MPDRANQFLQRTYGIHVIYRVTAPLPVSHPYPGLGVLTLDGATHDYPPYSEIILRDEKHHPCWFKHCTAEGHAEHTLAHGFKVEHRSLVERFLRLLVDAGKAEMVCGPHTDLYWMIASLPARSPQYDAFYTFGASATGRAARFGMLSGGELASLAPARH